MSGALTTDVAVVGAGPAGLAAALAARRSGASVLVIDSFGHAGGQYFMQPADGGRPGPQAVRGQQSIEAAAAAGVTFLPGHEVIAAYPGFQLFAAGQGRGASIRARAVVAANGAHERVMAFPGWTLPGVMTAGAGQRLAKVNGVLPGQRVAVAGSGIFLWAVAQTLLQKGAQIEALIEARRPSAELASHFAAHPERWGEALSLAYCVKSRVRRIAWGHMVREASGTNHLESISIGPTGGGPGETIGGLDALLISHGFQPNIEITSLLDCTHRFDEAAGGWHAVADAQGRTSIDGLYAVGEVTGVAGARPAILSGELAGYAAAEDLGLKPCLPRGGIERLARQLRRARRFGLGLGRLFAPLPELQSAQRDDTLLCRCEEVTRKDILAACRDGAHSLHAVKTWTRAGMGRCQGRMCRMSVTACVADATGRAPDLLGYNRSRVPTRPVPIDQILAAMEGTTPKQ